MSEVADHPELVLLYKAASIIQRESLLAALRDAGLKPIDAPRDMSRKITDSTVDLGLDGYSILFDGFSVFVPREEEATAREVLAKFLRERDAAPTVSDDTSPYLKKFVFCALFSFMLPGLLHIFGAYHLIKGLLAGEKVRTVTFWPALAVYLFTFSLVALAILNQLQS